MFELIATVLDHKITASLVSLIGVLENAHLNTFDGHIMTLLVEGLLDVCFVFGISNNGIVAVLSLRVNLAIELESGIHINGVKDLKIKVSFELEDFFEVHVVRRLSKREQRISGSIAKHSWSAPRLMCVIPTVARFIILTISKFEVFGRLHYTYESCTE